MLTKQVEDIKTIEVPHVVTPDYIYEEIFLTKNHRPVPAFVYYTEEEGIQYVDHIKDGAMRYAPMNLSDYPFLPLNEPTWFNDIKDLYDEILGFVREYLDFIDKRVYYIISSFILLTWVYQKFDTIPYLMFLGDAGSGKTKTLEVIQALSYHALLTPSITTGVIARVIEKYNVTLLIDESEVLNNEAKIELVSVINSGYRKGERLIRAKPNSLEPEFFNTFGPKALAGTMELRKTLTTRCITINMQKSIKRLPIKIDQDKAQTLRNKLLQFRLWYWVEKHPLETDIPIRDGRLNEIFQPMVIVTPAEYKSQIIDYAKSLEADRNIDDATSFEAYIFNAIITLNKNKMKSDDIISWLQNNTDLIIDVDSAYKLRSFKNKIGRTLKTKFGLKKDTQNYFHIDEGIIERLKSKYQSTDYQEQDIKSNETSKNTENNIYHESNIIQKGEEISNPQENIIMKEPQDLKSNTKSTDLEFPSPEEWYEYLHYDTKFLTVNDVTYALKRIRSEYYDVSCPKCNNQFIVRGTDKELQARLVMHTEKFHKDLEVN